MLLVVFGTRPEWIKIKPVIDAIRGKIPYTLLFTGQHTTLMDESIKDYVDHYLTVEDITGNRLDSIVYSLMKNFDLYTLDVTHVLVQGDTTSAFAAALCAFHRKIPVIHLEAGLRSYDKNNPYPEEFNRIAISAIADIHLCPTYDALENLQKEGISEKNLWMVGNTGLDGLSSYEVTHEKKVVVTLHRRENHEIISEWFFELSLVADKFTEYEFILVKHPNPNITNHIHELSSKIKVIDPVSRDEMARLLASCSYVITDSGGLQEEAAFFRKPCLVLRKTTERPEGIGWFSFLCEHPKDLPSRFSGLSMYKKIREDLNCPYGDGKSSQRVLEILEGIIDV